MLARFAVSRTITSGTYCSSLIYPLTNPFSISGVCPLLALLIRTWRKVFPVSVEYCLERPISSQCKKPIGPAHVKSFNFYKRKCMFMFVRSKSQWFDSSTIHTLAIIFTEVGKDHTYNTCHIVTHNSQH